MNGFETQLRDGMRRITQRSDTVFGGYTTCGQSLSAWNGKLPADLLAFYSRANGFWLTWGFASDGKSAPHGLRLYALSSDGESAFETDSKAGVPGLLTGRAVKDNLSGADALADDESALVLSGRLGEGGVLLRCIDPDHVEYLAFDSDGDFWKLGDSLDCLLQGLPFGYADGWERVAQAQGVRAPLLELKARLEEPSPPREYLKLEVTSVQTTSPHAHCIGIGAGLGKGAFDKVMKALGRSERAKSLDETARGKVFAAALGDDKSVTVATAKAVLMCLRKGSLPSKAKPKEILGRMLRWGEAESASVTFQVTDLKASGIDDLFVSLAVESALLEIGLPFDRPIACDHSFKKGAAQATVTYKDAAAASETFVIGRSWVSHSAGSDWY